MLVRVRFVLRFVRVVDRVMVRFRVLMSAAASIRRTAEVLQSRDPQAAAAALQEVQRAAAEGSNVMPPMIEAVSAYATLGEITRVLKSVFGEFREPSLF